jgi:hypothetical protein
VKKRISAGAGLIFKGSGFYITDYRSEKYKEAAKKDAAPASGGESKSGSGETKSSSGESKSSTAESKSPSKTESKSFCWRVAQSQNQGIKLFTRSGVSYKDRYSPDFSEARLAVAGPQESFVRCGKTQAIPGRPEWPYARTEKSTARRFRGPMPSCDP